MDERYMTSEQAAKALQIHYNTLRKWLKDGTLPGVKLGTRWRVSVAAIDKLMEQRAKEPEEKP
jgi:excisionase family DNA binding protein